ncbi:MAG: outer membrane beta-barrel protein [Acidobacteria bacterium]|nr:outer membrane beta-barrel protein [Acidobacteriota bacterium]
MVVTTVGLWARRFVLAAAVLVVSSPALAQARVGFTVGPALSKVSGEGISSSDAQWGIMLGLNLEYEIARDWQIDLEFGLSQKGGDKVVTPDGVFDYRFDYIEIPLTVSRLFWLNDGPWAVSPFAGLSIGLKSKCAIRPAGDRDVEFEECTVSTPGGDTVSQMYGLPFGVALRRRYPGGSSFAVEARYTAMLNSGTEAGTFMGKSNTFAVMASFTFPLDTGWRGTPSEPNPNR